MFNKILDFFINFWNQAEELMTWVLESIFYLLNELFYLIYDFALDAFETIVTALDFAQIMTLQTMQTWTGLPTQVIWLLNYLNVPILMAIILGAYSIRLLLNLIPGAATRI